MSTSVSLPGIGGRVAVVTGAAGGIGSAVTAVLREAGARVIGWDLDGAECRVDVTDRESVESAWADTESAVGEVDLLVNAAGTLTDDWDRCLAVNATGVRNVLDTGINAMIDRGRGSAVVVSSNAAAVPRTAMAAYAASKAAATSYARSIGLTAAPAGVRVNLVSPGSTDTPMLRQGWTGSGDAQRILAGEPDQYRLGIPLGRIAQPADIAASVLFLLSDAARHLCLHDLRVDGGATLDM